MNELHLVLLNKRIRGTSGQLNNMTIRRTGPELTMSLFKGKCSGSLAEQPNC